MNKKNQTSRLIPYTVAGMMCFLTAFLIGAGFWYFFGTKSNLHDKVEQILIETDKQDTLVAKNSDISNTIRQTPTPLPTPEIVRAPAGEIEVTAGEVTLGGGKTGLPLRRISVSAFLMGETEVTNSQYAKFIEATEHKAPEGWKDNKFTEGEENLPVVNMSWNDANDYCEWLSKEIGAEVRLPTEAEWERAARGDTENKYPWGDKWNDEASSSEETKGKILPVKSYDEGRSPFGIYEMIGNVWELTGDPAVDEFGKAVIFEDPETKETSEQRIIKGGWAAEEREFLTIDRHLYRPENRPSEAIGFRYVVIRR